MIPHTHGPETHARMGYLVLCTWLITVVPAASVINTPIWLTGLMGTCFPLSHAQVLLLLAVVETCRLHKPGVLSWIQEV